MSSLPFLIHRLGQWLWTLFYRSVGRGIFQSVGKGAVFEGWIDIPQREGRITIGGNVRICRFVEFSVPPGGELIIDDGVFIGRGVVISAHKRVAIGKHSLLAEYVSMHDNNHRSESSRGLIQSQGFTAEAIEVGADCWIGAHAILLKGSGLGDHSVLGAGAVLTKKFPNATKALGNPARPFVKVQTVATDMQ